MAQRASRQSSYSGSMRASLRLMAIAVLAWTVGGCAVSGHLGSLFGGTGGEGVAASAGETATGSIAATPASVRAIAADPPESDLAYARAAIVEVLARGKRDMSAPWENPQSGARGTVTPIATAYAQDGETCHGFLASYVRASSETWLQGEACQVQKGKWQVKSLKPWKRS